MKFISRKGQMLILDMVIAIIIIFSIIVFSKGINDQILIENYKNSQLADMQDHAYTASEILVKNNGKGTHLSIEKIDYLSGLDQNLLKKELGIGGVFYNISSKIFIYNDKKYVFYKSLGSVSRSPENVIVVDRFTSIGDKLAKIEVKIS